MKSIGIIPARYASTRFPGKPLALIQGKPMIVRVCERVSQARYLDDVLVATDDDRIAAVVKSEGYKVFRSQETHATGTDRIREASLSFDGDVVVNIQGDEPLISPSMIDAALGPFIQNPGLDVPVVTLIQRITDVSHLHRPDIVKVITDKRGKALYFSRFPLPASFIGGKLQEIQGPLPEDIPYYKHIGLYAFRADFLRIIPKLHASPLEKSEKLEQLRFLENGYGILCVPVTETIHGVDRPEDVPIVERMLDEERAKEKNSE